MECGETYIYTGPETVLIRNGTECVCTGYTDNGMPEVEFLSICGLTIRFDYPETYFNKKGST